ncbi:unnamed protein product [Boreogadus saida]
MTSNLKMNTGANGPFQGHWRALLCLGAEHAAAALVDPASCAACRELPEEGLLSRHLFSSPSVDLAQAIDIFRAKVPDTQDADQCFEVDDVASLDDVFPCSASEFSHSGASTEATIVPRERPRRMADLFDEIMGEALAIKGIPMPAPPLAPMSDDMQGECFATLSSSRRVTQCPLFPPVQHLFTAAGGDPSTLKAPVRAFTDFTNVEEWADTQAREIPRLEPSLAALLCPGAGWRPSEKPLPPDRLQKQIAGLTDRVFVCPSQSAAAVNNIALLSSALVSLSAGREGYRPEEAARWLTVSRFSSAILQLCQPVAVSAETVQGPLPPDGLFGPRFSELLAHQQSVCENRSRLGAILTGSSHQQAGRKRGPGRFQRSRGPPPPPVPMPQQPQPGRAAPEVPQTCFHLFLCK